MNKEIKQLDKSGMVEIIKDFPNQINEACIIGESIKLSKNYSEYKKILILGMGGSAIGGDLIKNFLKYTSGAEHLEININRDYSYIPQLDKDSIIIASSYSGNTEETLSSLNQAKERTDKIVVITSGGKLEQIAKENNYDLIKIPSGFQPRAALAFSFFPILYFFIKSSLLDNSTSLNIENNLDELIQVMKTNSTNYSEIHADNMAYNLAKNMRDKIPVIYSSQRLEIPNLRWRGQIQENSKRIAFGNIIPEMNHNEINSWEANENIHSPFFFLLFKDSDENPRNEKRIDFLFNLLKNQNRPIELIKTSKSNYLTRLFEIINLGDWVSFWIAILNEKDPTEIKTILKLKDHMGE